MEKNILEKYELVVGLEVHAQLATKSKIFAGDPTTYGQPPNTLISAITLAYPGIMPKVNKQVVEYAIRMGLACRCEISRYNIFDRKNYFYPDLPKGFQTTQEKHPICKGGYLEVAPEKGEKVKIRLNRIHMEEDAGKSIHLENEPETQVDLNRAGVPLIEIVSEPDIRAAAEAFAYLNEIRRLVRYLGICDGNMEEGSLRCDANVSVRRKGASELGKKVEIKNMNSARNVQRAIEHEFVRQVGLLEKKQHIVSETRTFNAANGKTYGMRTKEELNDYRYFPEPDLPPIVISEEYLEKIKQQMPALPWELEAKFTQQYQLPAYDAGVLTESREMAEFFEGICAHTQNYKAASNWLMGPIKSHLNEHRLEIAALPISGKQIADIIQLIDQKKVSYTTAAQILFPKLLANPDADVAAMAQKEGLLQTSDEGAVEGLVREVLEKMPQEVSAYQKGKKKLLGLFMGEVMKKGKGKINPQKANEVIRKVLAEM